MSAMCRSRAMSLHFVRRSTANSQRLTPILALAIALQSVSALHGQSTPLPIQKTGSNTEAGHVIYVYANGGSGFDFGSAEDHDSNPTLSQADTHAIRATASAVDPSASASGSAFQRAGVRNLETNGALTVATFHKSLFAQNEVGASAFSQVYSSLGIANSQWRITDPGGSHEGENLWIEIEIKIWGTGNFVPGSPDPETW